MSSFLARRAAAAPSAVRAFTTSSPRAVARITLLGNLGDSPELQPTSTGHEVIKYSVASSTGPRDNRHTSWFRVTKFLTEGDEKRRDFLLSIPKGSTVYVEGDASVGTYQDAEGKNRTALNIIQRSIEVIKRPNTDSSHE
ncbi:related to single-stranded DNA-binding protein [Cephalotrichum gorgonifer]|uniref:Single-stranded DNA-binding protein n=1 Tax=Cephalotrichum gorgonifer TaxID=2041049 RepID=A0AAE8MT00_9PEZI|nr:related to single-stranded DNA-binding protein [Cephalotrichum gorgonifer]